LDGLSEDRLLDGRVLLRQPENGYRAGIDPVLLAAAVPPPMAKWSWISAAASRAALCLAARVAGCRVFGLEMQPPLVGLARQNIEINGMTAESKA